MYLQDFAWRSKYLDAILQDAVIGSFVVNIPSPIRRERLYVCKCADDGLTDTVSLSISHPLLLPEEEDFWESYQCQALY
jgi:hypothetical protein